MGWRGWGRGNKATQYKLHYVHHGEGDVGINEIGGSDTNGDIKKKKTKTNCIRAALKVSSLFFFSFIIFLVDVLDVVDGPAVAYVGGQLRKSITITRTHWLLNSSFCCYWLSVPIRRGSLPTCWWRAGLAWPECCSWFCAGGPAEWCPALTDRRVRAVSLHPASLLRPVGSCPRSVIVSEMPATPRSTWIATCRELPDTAAQIVY